MRIIFYSIFYSISFLNLWYAIDLYYDEKYGYSVLFAVLSLLMFLDLRMNHQKVNDENEN